MLAALSLGSACSHCRQARGMLRPEGSRGCIKQRLGLG